MVNLQAGSKNSIKDLRPGFLKVLLYTNFLALIITFALNFLGSPLLKYHYLLHVLITLAAVLLFDVPKILPIIFTLFFIEGQGRIIWEYSGWARIVFDVLMLFSVLRIFIVNKKFIDLKIIPLPLAFLFFFHFAWFAVEFFNFNSVSHLAVLFSTKVHVYPLLLFLGLSMTDLSAEQKGLKNSIAFLLFLIFLEIALSFYQFVEKQQLLLSISSYYNTAMKEGVFANLLFRPFATAQVPGAIASFLYLTVGLLFLYKGNKKQALLKGLLVVLSVLAIIISQIRSAFLKYALIVLLIQLGAVFYDRQKSKKMFLALLLSLLTLVAVVSLSGPEFKTGDQAIDLALERINTLTTPSKIKNTRLNLSEFAQITSDKLSKYPLGIGPGLTGPAASLSKEELSTHAQYSSAELFTADNLFVALFIDFGIGAIFYIGILFFVLFYFLKYLVLFYIKKRDQDYRVLLVCFSSIFVIIFGNWAINGLTYNPESFIFWFICALGLSTINNYKKLTQNV